MRILEEDERATELLCHNDRCIHCGYADPYDLVVSRFDPGHERSADCLFECRECWNAMSPSVGDDHFVALLPELPQAAISHLVRVLGIASYAAAGNCSAHRVLDLLEHGFSDVAWPRLIEMGGSGTATSSGDKLGAIVRDVFGGLLAREADARRAFGSSSPEAVRRAIDDMGRQDAEEAHRLVRLVPRRLTKARIQLLQTPLS